MKKFFGVVGLLFCVFLASCNFSNLSGKSGTIEFSIPLSDVVQITKQAVGPSASRAGAGDTQILCLVQVKGSRNFYDYHTIPLDVKFEESPEKDFIVDTSFDQIPAGQSYTVMFDLFVKDEQGLGKDSPTIYADVFSGRASNVSVKGGKTTEVNIKADYLSETFLSLKLDFADGSSKTLKGLTLAEMEDENITNEKEMWKLQDRMMAELKKAGDKLMYYKWDGTSLEVKDIYYVLDDNSNCADSSFKYAIYYTSDGSNDYQIYNLNFKKNVCSIKDLILSKQYFNSDIVIARKDNFLIEIPSTKINYWVDEQEPYIDPSIFEEKDLQFEKTDFIKYDDQDNEIYRYVCVIPLSQIALADSETEGWIGAASSITDGKALAITLSTDYNDTLASVEQFYYMLQPDNYSSIDLSERYTGNNCIIFAEKNYLDPSESFELTLPINNLTGTDTRKNLILFFDKINGDSSYTISGCSMMSVLYPEGTAIFATSRNYDYSPDAAHNPNAESYTKNPWRFELKYPLGELSGINTNDTLTVKMSGIVSVGDINLRAEVFDAIGDGWDSISTESADGNRLYFTVNGSRLNGDSDSSFIFKSVRIIKPDTPGQKHDFSLQCTSEYGLGPDIIAIKNFNVSTELATPVNP